MGFRMRNNTFSLSTPPGFEIAGIPVVPNQLPVANGDSLVFENGSWVIRAEPSVPSVYGNISDSSGNIAEITTVVKVPVSNDGVLISNSTFTGGNNWVFFGFVNDVTQTPNAMEHTILVTGTYMINYGVSVLYSDSVICVTLFVDGIKSNYCVEVGGIAGGVGTYGTGYGSAMIILSAGQTIGVYIETSTPAVAGTAGLRFPTFQVRKIS